MASNAPSGDGEAPSDPPKNPLRKYMKGLGTTAIIFGALSVVLSGVLVSLNDKFVTDYVGSGVWCGLFFIAQGFCVLNTFSTAISTAAIATIVTSVASTLLASTMIGVISTSLTIQSDEDVYVGFKAGEGFLILLGVLEIGLSVFCVAFGILFLQPNKQDSPTNAQNPETDEQEDPHPFPSIQHQRSVKWMGLWQAAVGLASLIDNSVTVSQKLHIEDIGVGIWCGVIFLAIGILTFFAASLRKKKPIIATVVMSIFCATLVIFMMVWSAMLMLRVGYYYNNRKIVIAYGLLIALSLGELIMLIWCAVVCCKAVCTVACWEAVRRPECCTNCCVPQIVLHIQEAGRDPQAAQGGPRLVPVTDTARDYTIGSQIHVQIRLTNGQEQTGGDQSRYQE